MTYTPEQLRSEAEGLDSFSPGISGRWVAPRLIAFAAALERIKVLEGQATADAVQIAEQQAKIDRLMLEYCPDAMTCEQMATWAAHQRPVENGELP